MYLVFEIGGTNMRIGVSADGQILKETKIVPTQDDFRQSIQTFKQVADELSGGEKIEGIAGGVAGALDKERTMIAHRGSSLAGWESKPLKGELERQFECKVILENDTSVAGIGEATSGAGKGKSVVAYVAIGTGVGGKRIVDGRIDSKGYNFEPGHQIIVPDGDLCHCGGKGHFEVYVGGVYIAEKNQRKAEDIKDTEFWENIGKYLAIGLTNTIVHWDPDIVVLGGSIMRSIPLESVKKFLKEDLTIYPQPPDLVLATLGDNAGLYGSLELLKEK